MDQTNLNGIRVTTGRDGKTLFIPLPKDLWRLAGDCRCGRCDGKAYWDTLAVGPDASHTWTVHFPELHR